MGIYLNLASNYALLYFTLLLFIIPTDASLHLLSSYALHKMQEKSPKKKKKRKEMCTRRRRKEASQVKIHIFVLSFERAETRWALSNIASVTVRPDFDG